MNIMNKVTLQSMKKNRTRTIVTIVGIILSVSMVTAVTTIVTSLQNYLLESAVYKNGDWHVELQNVSVEEGKRISDDARVEDTVYTEYLGYAMMEASKNENKPYLYVMGANEESFENLPVHITKGRLPQNDMEIILPSHLETDGGVSYNIDDDLVLPLGDRIIEGEKLFQNNPLITVIDEKTYEIIGIDESLETKMVKQYNVVGFYERSNLEEFSAPGYTAITYSDFSDNSALCDAYYTMKNPNDTYSFCQDYCINGYGGITNTDVLMYQGVSEYETFSSAIYNLVIILVVIIMLGSIALIYNAFSISVSERTVQFGLLSSIGATKKQIRKSVRFEAMVLGLIGIPLGILAGIGGIWVTFLILGDRLKIFGNTFSGSENISFNMSVNWWGIAVAVVVACITLIISVVKPAFRASKITAIEAIRSSKDISDKKADRKNHKTRKVTYKLFGLPGVLAKKYYTRSSKKYRATVISLFMSIVLFVSASSFIMYLTSGVNDFYYRADYDISAGVRDSDGGYKADDLLRDIRQFDSVDKAMSYVMNFFSVRNGDEILTDKGKEALVNKYGLNSFSEIENGVEMFLIGVDDKTYDEYILSLGLDPESLSENDAVIYGLGQTIDYKNGTVSSFDFIENEVNAVDFCTYYYDSDTDELSILECYSLNVVKTADTMPFGFNGRNAVSGNVIYCVVRDDIDIFREGSSSQILIDSNNSSETEKELHNLSGIGSIYNYTAEFENSRTLVLVINVFAYGFIVLISLISVTNVFNTIVTNLMLRQRDFAMLRSVGMTKGGFRKMMIYECLIYGTKALLFGIPVSFLITLWIYKSMGVAWNGGFLIPWAAYGIVVVSVFLVVLISMIYAMAKINKSNLVETLRKESI